MAQDSTTFSRDVYDAAHAGAAFVDRTAVRGRLIVAGADRAAFLQGLVTNDTASLKSGQGCYAAMLTPQGRMITDLWVYELGDVMLLSMPRATKDTLLGKLDQFIFSEDVQLGDVTATFAQLAIIGPEAAAAASSLFDAVPAGALNALPEHGNLRATIQEQPVIVSAITDPGVAGFELYVEEAALAGLVAALRARGVKDATGPTAETLRIEAGVPLFGTDMDAETIPLEAGIESRAISFTKGCYVGQEVIVRVLHRGHGRVARRLVGFRFDDSAAVPPAGAKVRAGDRDIGEITSAAFSPALGSAVALGYAHRDFTAAGTEVTVDGHPAIVAELPFVRR